MRRRFSVALKQLKRNTVIRLAGASSPHRQAIVSIALLVITELALLALTFCTNFLSAFIHNTVEVFHNFRLRSLDNALSIVAAEKRLGIFVEEPMQRWHEKHIGGWSFWNTYYAGVHPVVTVIFLVFILLRMVAWKLTRVNWKRLNEGSSSAIGDDGVARSQSGYVSFSSPPSPSIQPVASESLYYSPSASAVVYRGFSDLTPPQQYRFLRSVWVIGAWIAFFGFLFVPAMPPRLLPICDFFNAAGANVGGCLTTEFSFVDSIGKHGSLLWDWNDESVKTLNNPYAAFPSQHTIFAAWCALTWIHLIPAPAVRSLLSLRYWLVQLARWSIVIYPCVTMYCIVITANHYIADALVGLIALAISYAIVYFYYSFRSRGIPRNKELPSTVLPY